MDMDQLSEHLSSSASVHEPGVYSAASPHPRFGQYKSSAWTKNSQQKRREELLQRQKASREDKLDQCRRDSISEQHGRSPGGKKLYLSGYFANQLMHSEWLVDVPENFASNWYMVPCPVGKRTLVVATGGETKLYSKNGYLRTTCLTQLSGGNKKHSAPKTMLDCIYCPKNKILYILDVIMWKDTWAGQGERSFRHFWLQSRFEEHPELETISDYNQHKFALLPQFSCDKSALEAAMNTEYGFELDGVLFYCNDAYYEPGLTPLVGWLKPFMLKEVLHLETLPPRFQHRSGMDDHETTAAEFIREYKQAEAGKKLVTSPKKDQTITVTEVKEGSGDKTD